MDIITALITNPNSILTILALLAVGFLGFLVYLLVKHEIKSFKTTVEISSAQVDLASSNFQNKLEVVNKELKTHSDNMGKMTKAVAGDFLKVQEKIFDLKQDLLTEVEKVRTLANETTANLKLANEISKLSIEGMNEKLGRIIVIEKDIEVIKRQFPKIQESVGHNHLEVTKNTSQVGDLVKLYEKLKDRINAIESKKKG